MKYFLYALCLALIVLKLTGFIDWSWWLIMLPVYGGAVLWIILFSLAVFIKVKTDKKPTIVKKSKFQDRLDDYMDKQRSQQLRDMGNGKV